MEAEQKTLCLLPMNNVPMMYEFLEREQTEREEQPPMVLILLEKLHIKDGAGDYTLFAGRCENDADLDFTVQAVRACLPTDQPQSTSSYICMPPTRFISLATDQPTASLILDKAAECFLRVTVLDFTPWLGEITKCWLAAFESEREMLVAHGLLLNQLRRLFPEDAAELDDIANLMSNDPRNWAPRPPVQ